jgi:thiosulfate/3-mercaptopyruvate sulfurtransferase
MDCASCHQADEMHAAAPEDLKSRYGLEQAVACTDCHRDLRHGSVREHTLHVHKVQCQVCHSQTYVNCYSCHVGKDEEGVAFFQNRLEVEMMKIGRNPSGTDSNAEFRYMLLRHVPADPEMFDFYGKGGFTRFGNTPTWKRASPHNIQRRTWQTASCNHCHGNRQLFLSGTDLRDYEREANLKVVVPDEDLPGARSQIRMVDIDVSDVRTGMVVDTNWLHENLKEKDLVVIDARSRAAYDKGHIEGAIHLDPVTSGLRSSSEVEKPFTLMPHRKVVKILGGKGIAADDHIVVYDKDGMMAGALMAVLEWAGATHISYLNGGIEGWHHAGFHTRTEATGRKAKVFDGAARPELIEDSVGVARLIERRNAVLVDTRLIDRAQGLSRHEDAERAGAIPGSINLPIGSFYMDNGYLKPPEELLWMLKIYGITPDKTVITTCDTGTAASGAYFVLRYLGFPDVRVHDEAWVNWTRIR